MQTMIEIQDAYIARVATAKAKMGRMASGARFARTRRAARNEAAKASARMGYSEAQIEQIIRDAHDMVELELAGEDE